MEKICKIKQKYPIYKFRRNNYILKNFSEDGVVAKLTAPILVNEKCTKKDGLFLLKFCLKNKISCNVVLGKDCNVSVRIDPLDVTRFITEKSTDENFRLAKPWDIKCRILNYTDHIEEVNLIVLFEDDKIKLIGTLQFIEVLPVGRTPHTPQIYDEQDEMGFFISVWNGTSFKPLFKNKILSVEGVSRHNITTPNDDVSARILQSFVVILQA